MLLVRFDEVGTAGQVLYDLELLQELLFNLLALDFDDLGGEDLVGVPHILGLVDLGVLALADRVDGEGILVDLAGLFVAQHQLLYFLLHKNGL